MAGNQVNSNVMYCKCENVDKMYICISGVHIPCIHVVHLLFHFLFNWGEIIITFSQIYTLQVTPVNTKLSVCLH